MSDEEDYAEFQKLIDDCLDDTVIIKTPPPMTRKEFEEISEKLIHGKVLPRCTHCKQKEAQHMPDGKCLYGPMNWSPP